MNNRKAIVVANNHSFHHPQHPQHSMIGVTSEEAASKTFRCSGCKEHGFGPRYQCATTNCPFMLHQACSDARPRHSEELKFMGIKYKFEFSWETPKGRLPCDACGRDISGFGYHGKHSGGQTLDLHPCCTKLKSTMRDPYKGMTMLTLKNKMPLKAKCVCCKKNNNDTRGWSYVSSTEDYGYHVSCMKKWIRENWGMVYVAYCVVKG